MHFEGKRKELIHVGFECIQSEMSLSGMLSSIKS